MYAGFFWLQQQAGIAVSRPAGCLANRSGHRCHPRFVRSHETRRRHRPRPGGSDCQHGMLDKVEALAIPTRGMLEQVIACVRDVAEKEVMPRYLKVAQQRKSDG